VIWVVKETIQTVKIEVKALKKFGNYLPSNKLLLIRTGNLSSSFEINLFLTAVLTPH